MLKVRTDKQFDESIVRASGNQALRTRPIYAVNAPNMMVLLFQNYIDLLCASSIRRVVVHSSARVNLIAISFFVPRIVQLWQCTDLESLRISAKHKVIAARTEAACPDRLVIPQLCKLFHMAHCRVDDRLYIADDLQG